MKNRNALPVLGVLAIIAGASVFIVRSCTKDKQQSATAKPPSETQTASTMNTRQITTTAIATIASVSSVIGDD